MDEHAPPAKRSKLTDNNALETSHTLIPAPSASTTPSNVEDAPISFEKLAETHPELLKYLKTNASTGTSHFNFMSEESVRLYNQALLHDWFGIKIELPPNHLCPTALSRTRYIRWIAELLKHCCGEEKVGIDIGTGASCVYPLIGHAIFGWKFLASDIDEDSMNWAAKNVELNGWSKSITIARAKRSNDDKAESKDFKILDGLLDLEDVRNVNGGPSYSKAHFTMCNPPYFDSPEEKFQRDDTVCVATDGELATAGGEEEFVRQMVRESAEIGVRVSWFTTLLGKKSSLKPLLRYIQTFDVTDVQHTTFVQGKNSRWAIAWTFDPDVKASVILERAKSIRYTSTTFAFDIASNSLDGIGESLNTSSFGLRFRASLNNPAVFNATMYTDNTWLNATFDQAASKALSRALGTPSTIGPPTRPSSLFTVKATVIQSSHAKNLTLSLEMAKGTVDSVVIAGTTYSSEHVFGVLLREMKDLIGL